MDPIALLGSVMGLSFTSGINLYATVLTTGLAIRNEWVTSYPEGLDVLGSTPVLAIAGVLYTCEFIADKIPAFDTFWDVVHTFVRPFAGAGIAFAATGNADPGFAAAMTLVGGGVAATTHATKSCTRLVINTSPEPVSNIVVSFLEDIGAVGLAYLAVAHPYAALAIVVVLLSAIYYFGPIIIRFLIFLVHALFCRLASLFTGQKDSEYLPGDHLAVLGADQKVTLAAKTFARRCGKAGSNRKGFITLGPAQLQFTYRKRFRIWLESVPLADIATARVKRGFLYDALEINRVDGTVVKFFFTKTREDLAERFCQAATAGVAPAAATPAVDAAPDGATA